MHIIFHQALLYLTWHTSLATNVKVSTALGGALAAYGGS